MGCEIVSEREHLLRCATTHSKVNVVLMSVKLKFAIRLRKPAKLRSFGLTLLLHVGICSAELYKSL
jgi:hypothetical protein